MAFLKFNMVAVFYKVFRLWFIFVDSDDEVEVSFAYSNGTSIDTKVLVKQASEWKADQGYRLNKDLQMSPSLRSYYEWSEWLKNFTSFLGTIAFARKFWDLGEFILPFDTSMYAPANINLNLNSRFARASSGTGTSWGTPSGAGTPSGITSSSASATGGLSTPITNNITSVKTIMSAKHPLTQMLKMDQAAYDMQFINDFYVRVIEFILRVFQQMTQHMQFLLHFQKVQIIYLKLSTQWLIDFLMWLKMFNYGSALLVRLLCIN